MRQFSLQHLVVLAVLVGLSVTAIRAPRLIPPRALGVTIGGAYAVETIVNATNGTWTASFNLPLHLSDVVAIFAPVALWTLEPLLVEVLYFWALSASLQAVITPDLHQAFPSVFFFTYFTTHCGAVVAACLLVFGLRRPIRPGAIRRAFLATLLMAAVAGTGDLITGGDYMYLRAKPDQASLLDDMGPWPVYIAVAAVIALAMFAVLYGLSRLAGAPSPAGGAGDPRAGRSPAAGRTARPARGRARRAPRR